MLLIVVRYDTKVRRRSEIGNRRALWVLLDVFLFQMDLLLLQHKQIQSNGKDKY